MAITEIASLTVVKQYLRIPNPDQPNPDDPTIQILMGAAQEAIEHEVGIIVAKPVTAERHDGGTCEIWLREIPVLYVSNVQEGWGYYDRNLEDQEVNSIPALSIWAYSLDNPEEGLVTRRGPGNILYPFVHGRNNIRVDYTAGRTVMPANAVLAFCELVSIWYRQSQLRMGGGGAQLGMTAATSGGIEGLAYNAINHDFSTRDAETSINLGVPQMIIEMLNSAGRRRPIIG